VSEELKVRELRIGCSLGSEECKGGEGRVG
jgi:hypothetical protein